MLSILAVRMSRKLIRLLGRGGTDFPGRIALKICPGLLGVLAKGVTTIVVTHESGVANETNKIVHIKDGLIGKIEENLDHTARPFGINGIMK